MTRRAYRVVYTPEAVRHLRALGPSLRSFVLDEVERQLRHQPTAATRNRKLLRANPVATWELRLGAIRVYFDVEAMPSRIVTVRAIGRKLRERVVIGGEEVDLS